MMVPEERRIAWDAIPAIYRQHLGLYGLTEIRRSHWQQDEIEPSFQQLKKVLSNNPHQLKDRAGLTVEHFSVDRYYFNEDFGVRPFTITTDFSTRISDGKDALVLLKTSDLNETALCGSLGSPRLTTMLMEGFIEHIFAVYASSPRAMEVLATWLIATL